MTRAEKIVEESESQEQWEMANLRPRRTGLPMTIWVQEPSDDSRTQHGPRIKAGRQHGDRFDPTDSVTVTVEENPKIIGIGLRNHDQRLVREFVRANREPLLDLWNHRIDIGEFLERMTPVQ